MGQGVAVIILAFSRTIWISLPDMFLFGLFPGMFTTVFLATIQATVPNDKLGRVLAADEVGSYALVPFGQYAGGEITLYSNVMVTYLAAGVGTAAVGLFMASVGGLRRLAFEPEESLRPVVPPPGATGEILVADAPPLGGEYYAPPSA
jgi:hypothetical protein